MFDVTALRVSVQQRLAVAAEEIFELFERSIAEYENTQRELLKSDPKPQVRLHETVTGVQLLSVSEDEFTPEQQDWSSGMDQYNQPKPQLIKKEREELWTNQEGEQQKGMDEADIIKFTFNPVPVKTEEDDEGSSQLRLTEDMKTGADGDDSGVSGPNMNFNPASEFHSSIDGSFDMEETSESNSDLRNQAEKPFCCSVCGKMYQWMNSLKGHMRLHSERKCFSCPICNKTFPWKGHVVRHMSVHTGEKPFTCSVCGKGFTQRPSLILHLRSHTGEKPFSCSVCEASFTRSQYLTQHMKMHSGEKSFICPMCGKGFTKRSALITHVRGHTEQKPFTCNIFKTSFSCRTSVSQHMKTLTGE